MNIVLIVGSYYPYSSAVGTCCFNLVEELIEKNNVTVICMKARTDQSEIEEYRKHTIIRVSHRWWNVRLKLTEKLRTKNRILKFFFKGLLNGIRVMEYIKIIFSRASLQKSLVESYFNALNNIKAPIDAVIPMCFPMEAVVAGMEFKKKESNTKLIPYLFDPFVESHTLHRTKWNKRLKRNANLQVEKKMIELSAKVFCVNHMFEHLDKLNVLQGHVIPTEHPMLRKNPYINSNNNDNNTVITYTGVFDKFVRNPEYFLKIMQTVLYKCDFELHLFTSGNCGDIIDFYMRESDGKIIDHGYVSKKDADLAVANSGILVSVGNQDNLQSPSKVFEYMSVGKPIVHFYNNDDDLIVKLLKSYPMSLCLKQDELLIEQNSQLFIEFHQTCSGKTLDFSEIENKFFEASPNYIASKMLNIIESIENKNEIKEIG